MFFPLFRRFSRSAGTQASTSHAATTPQGTPAGKTKGKPPVPGGGTKPAASPARPTSVKAAGVVNSPTTVRKNACTKYEEVLKIAAEKLSKSGSSGQPSSGSAPEGEVADPSKLAQEIELACHTAFGAALAPSLHVTSAQRSHRHIIASILCQNGLSSSAVAHSVALSLFSLAVLVTVMMVPHMGQHWHDNVLKSYYSVASASVCADHVLGWLH